MKIVSDNTEAMIGPVQQDWVLAIPYMQQSVLMAAVRAPDGLRKNHPVKVLMRYYRRCVLYSAIESKKVGYNVAMLDPLEEGGGSFTGPFTWGHAKKVFPKYVISQGNLRDCFDMMRKVYLEHVDEIPHHFQLHFMHAAQIIGVHHDNSGVRSWWRDFYLMIVNDAHLHPETDEEMNARLSDNRDEWLKREVVTAE